MTRLRKDYKFSQGAACLAHWQDSSRPLDDLLLSGRLASMRDAARRLPV